jgi:mono/diheme cytochrome c family protein/glucose/arabinose dehydrogenase
VRGLSRNDLYLRYYFTFQTMIVKSQKTLLLLGFTLCFFLAKSQTINPKNTAKGKNLFETQCGSCHGISNGNFGPKLGGVHATRPLEELYNFIKNPSLFIQNGDVRTKVLLDKYKTEMPAFAHLKDTEIKSIFEYIKQQSDFLKESPLIVENPPKNTPIKLYSSPIKSSNLWIELEDFIKLPIQPNTPNDKGIATLRSSPNNSEEIFVSDQMGLIYRIKNKQKQVYFDIRKFKPDFIFSPGIGTGLGSFDFHPDFQQNGIFYTTHAEPFANKIAINSKAWADSIGVGLQWVITEWQHKNPADSLFEGIGREVLRFNTPTTAHGGQDLSFVPNLLKNDSNYGLLYLGIGDGGSNNIKLPELCHSPKSLLGTVIRIDPMGKNGVFDSYGIPPDNPFATQTDQGIQKEIYAFGFRNPHRLAWFEGKLLVADIGEANIEEVNLVEKGGDYGWSNQEGAWGVKTKIDKTVLFEISETEMQKYRLPIAQYDHNEGKAISGGFVYKGYLKALENKYFFGDIVTGKLYFMNTENLKNDNEIFNVNIISEGKETTLKELANLKRAHLRIGFDQNTGDLFIMTKNDQSIRKVKKAYFK